MNQTTANCVIKFENESRKQSHCEYFNSRQEANDFFENVFCKGQYNFNFGGDVILTSPEYRYINGNLEYRYFKTDEKWQKSYFSKEAVFNLDSKFSWNCGEEKTQRLHLVYILFEKNEMCFSNKAESFQIN